MRYAVPMAVGNKGGVYDDPRFLLFVSKVSTLSPPASRIIQDAIWRQARWHCAAFEPSCPFQPDNQIPRHDDDVGDISHYDGAMNDELEELERSFLWLQRIRASHSMVRKRASTYEDDSLADREVTSAAPSPGTGSKMFQTRTSSRGRPVVSHVHQARSRCHRGEASIYRTHE